MSRRWLACDNTKLYYYCIPNNKRGEVPEDPGEATQLEFEALYRQYYYWANNTASKGQLVVLYYITDR